jgi:SAM-dependent methyltransferase
MGIASIRGRGEAKPANAASVIWHDLECGFYTADLELWRGLAEQARERDGAPARILDVGAGTGRAALALAAAGHDVTALDLDAELLDALARRAGDAGLQIETVCADARTFELHRGEFALCVVPMQTIQLLGGSAGRVALFRQARAHLRAGAPLACAIVTELDPFDCARGDVGPTPEVAQVNGARYISRATSVRVRGRTIRIERERRVVPIDESARVPTTARGVRAPEPQRDVIELDRVGVSQLQREGLDAGLSPVEVLQIAATHEHVGSNVVVLRA